MLEMLTGKRLITRLAERHMNQATSSEVTDQDIKNAGREITELITLLNPICVYNVRRARRYVFKHNII
jgi:hypothetical protein